MRTLSLVEVEQVSGAGTIANVISALCNGIGTLVEPTQCNPSNGTKPDGNKLTITPYVPDRWWWLL